MKLHKLFVLGMSDDLWDRVRGLGNQQRKTDHIRLIVKHSHSLHNSDLTLPTSSFYDFTYLQSL